MGDASICPNCGYDMSNAQQKKEQETKKATPSPENNPIWEFFEPYLPEIGKYSWIVILIVGIILFVLDVLTIDVWGIISNALVIVIAIMYVKPKFTPALMEKKYEELLNDTIPMGSIRIPMMLLMGIALEIVGMGWIGLFVLIPAIVLLFFSPFIPYNWNAQ